MQQTQAMIRLLTWALMALWLFAGTAAGTDQPVVLNDIGTVRISADSLIVPGGGDNHAEFSGHVQAVGERFTISADNLKIFYQPVTAGNEGHIASGNTLTRIIASGNVVITSGEKIAKTEEAVYDKDLQTIVLTGKKSTVMQNNSYISGEKIVMHTDSDAVTVESGQENRVEAFIQTRDIEKNDH
jgi:lipopolysaccharide export system protein LptA